MEQAGNSEQERPERTIERLRGVLVSLEAELEASEDLTRISYNVAPEIRGLFEHWRTKIRVALGE